MQRCRHTGRLQTKFLASCKWNRSAHLSGFLGLFGTGHPSAQYPICYKRENILKPVLTLRAAKFENVEDSQSFMQCDSGNERNLLTGRWRPAIITRDVVKGPWQPLWPQRWGVITTLHQVVSVRFTPHAVAPAFPFARLSRATRRS